MFDAPFQQPERQINIKGGTTLVDKVLKVVSGVSLLPFIERLEET